MKKLNLLIALLYACTNALVGQFYGSQVTYNYNVDSNRCNIEVLYWRLCNTWGDPSLNTLKIEAPGCSGFNIPLTTTIKDIGLHKDRYAGSACKKVNDNNGIDGYEEFVSSGSFALDTAPFKDFAKNGCCKVYFSYFYLPRPVNSITTGAQGSGMNYAMLDICKLAGTPAKKHKSPDFLYQPYSLELPINVGNYLNFGAYGYGNDSLIFGLKYIVGTSRTDDIPPSAPLDITTPMTPYCLFGTSVPCTPMPKADPPVGFYLDPKEGMISFTPTVLNEAGMTAIEVRQYLKDTNGVRQLVGLMSREFFMKVVAHANNNKPTIKSKLGNITYLMAGDTFKWEVESKDDSVSYPSGSVPPTNKLDSSFLDIRSDIKGFTVKIDSARAQSAVVTMVMDSSHVQGAAHVFGAMAYDNQAPNPYLSAITHKLFVREKLDFAVKVNKLTCGKVSFKLLIDSADSIKVIGVKGNIKVGNYTSAYQSIMDSFVVTVLNTGNWTYQISDNHTNDRYGFLMIDTFSYTGNVLNVSNVPNELILCSGVTEVYRPKVWNESTDSVAFQWLGSGTVFSTADSFIIESPIRKYLSLKISTSQCSTSYNINTNTFNMGMRSNKVIDQCKSSCYSVILENYLQYPLFYFSALGFDFEVMNATVADSFIDAQNRYNACKAFSFAPIKTQDIILLHQRGSNTCRMTDTLTINLKRQRLKFADSSVCYQDEDIPMGNFTSDRNEFDSIRGYIGIFDSNRAAKYDLLNNVGGKYYFKIINTPLATYKALMHTKEGGCSYQDSVKITLLPNPKPVLTSRSIDLCSNSGEYNLLLNAPETYNYSLKSINNQPYNGNDSNYFLNNKFLIKPNAATYKAEVIKQNNTCYTKDSIQFKVYLAPVYSLGNDYNIDPHAILRLKGSVSVHNNLWLIKGKAYTTKDVNGQAQSLLDTGYNHIIYVFTNSFNCTGRDTLIVYMSPTSSVSDLAVLNGISVYPNPLIESSVWLKGLQQGNYSVDLMDVTGRNLLNQLVEISTVNTDFEVDLANISNGIYFLSVSNTDSKKVFKVEINR